MSYSGSYSGSGGFIVGAGGGGGGAITSVNGQTGIVTIPAFAEQEVVLASLPANAWTPFPATPQLSVVTRYRVRDGASQEDITDCFDIRDAGASHEIRSLTAHTNLQITAYGPAA